MLFPVGFIADELALHYMFVSSSFSEKKCLQISNENKSEAKSRFSADELLDKADEYLETFNYDMARRFCQRAVELDALNCRALEMSGLLFLQADKADLAIGVSSII